MLFAENLRTVRKDRNLTQEELAELLGVSRQAISKWESGDGYPETEKLIAISKELNVSIDYLLNGTASVEEENKQVSISSGRIAIIPFDGDDVLQCQSVRSFKVFGNKKGPKYVLFGITGINFWGEQREILGWYKNEDDIKKEIEEINKAIGSGKLNYSLKYYADVEPKGIFGINTFK